MEFTGISHFINKPGDKYVFQFLVDISRENSYTRYLNVNFVTEYLSYMQLFLTVTVILCWMDLFSGSGVCVLILTLLVN